MPFTMNGIGTSVCGSRGFVDWGGTKDYDAVECFVVFFMPVIPYSAVHTFGWDGQNYRRVPIRWSWDLLLRAYLRHWIWTVAFGAVICLAIAILGPEPPRTKAILVGVAVPLAALVAFVVWGLRATDGRTRRIRRVLGRSDMGSSDPATWTDKLLGTLSGPQAMFQVSSYAAAVPKLVDAGDFAGAMLAARLSVVLESAPQGEELTDAILNLPAVQAASAK